MCEITNEVLPSKDGEIAIYKTKIEYCQNLDCCQLESDHPDGYQILTVETDDGGGGKFIRINTNSAGWSFDNPDDLLLVINDFKSRCE